MFLTGGLSGMPYFIKVLSKKPHQAHGAQAAHEFAAEKQIGGVAGRARQHQRRAQRRARRVGQLHLAPEHQQSAAVAHRHRQPVPARGPLAAQRSGQRHHQRGREIQNERQIHDRSSYYRCFADRKQW